MSNQTWQERKSAAIPNGIGIMCDFYVQRALNAEIWDIEGRRYIDFAAGIAVANTGHCHPKIVAAVQQQASQFTHTAFQISPYSSYVELAEKVNRAAPGNHKKKTAFFTTGAEAVENAIKIARAATGRTGIIAFSGAFHGRTFMGMALTGKVAPYKLGFGPFPGEIYHAPFPNALHGVSSQDSLDAIEALFKTDIDPKRVAAIILEPVQGEGGFYVAPFEFIRGLRALCDKHGILLIADEVQTGFGRTGKMFAIEYSGVIPDLMTMAKSLAGGMPLSGVCGKAEIMDAPVPGALGGTYAGNPLALASALAVLDIIEDEQLLARANASGEKLRASLRALQAITPEIADIRGLGAMIAVEFKHADSGKPNPEFAGRVQKNALKNGLILLTCGIYGNVIRFLFPLTIPDQLLDEGLLILADAVKSSRA
ncbi:4-aminobutyrate--2-oxoglutarate transaminase [Paralcaligenes sp. KSB-10]|uniref:4-aminobutyrate--2-oxoglutarate transaminase n=1 Tax=Paralcaligenes sp. KSB-10 TaxID=2901142 RepID=UPI001E53FC37|nr:4-aminobutyrate--2-oxoglutarate transaminase [Paralcaligenes sp. KSB-10]UHL65971.1 4-aminobutyrate--2-oxoglutarate transaminase [Paralcaligenes sp. KSB-10]